LPVVRWHEKALGVQYPGALYKCCVVLKNASTISQLDPSSSFLAFTYHADANLKIFNCEFIFTKSVSVLNVYRQAPSGIQYTIHL
jgi:hypothetical protein